MTSGLPAAEHPQPRSPAPLRGTQSFVGVFLSVWKRPGLTARELLWRWLTAVPLLLLLWQAGRPALRRMHLDAPALEAMTVFQPAAAAHTLGQAGAVVLPPVVHLLRWWLPLALLLWTAAGTLGAVALWRRQDPALRGSGAAVLVLSLLRSLGLLCAFALWGLALWAAGRAELVTPVQAFGGEPNLVVFAALGVAATLVLFVGWSLLSWVLDAARVLALRDSTGPARSLRSALHAPLLRSKLIELNLVMGIVRVALLVLATVASATPLPFESVEGPGFLKIWWCVVAVVYLAASDLVQVVRRSAALYLLRALEPGAPR